MLDMTSCRAVSTFDSSRFSSVAIDFAMASSRWLPPKPPDGRLPLGMAPLGIAPLGIAPLGREPGVKPPEGAPDGRLAFTALSRAVFIFEIGRAHV